VVQKVCGAPSNLAGESARIPTRGIPSDADYQFIRISADTSTRRWIAAGQGDRAQYVAQCSYVGSQGPETGLEEINGDFLEADLWPASSESA